MRVVALLCVRNEELTLTRCLEHLHAQGVEVAVIDNDSEDATRAIAESFRDRCVVHIERLPFEGVVDIAAHLRAKERLAGELEADWLFHQGADEIREAPAPYATLCDGFAAAEAAGYNAVNFDEFVFVPAEGESFEGTDYVARMRRYYFFEPVPDRLITAWKRGTEPVDLVSFAGHRVVFTGQRIFPVNFVVRHYITLSREHAARTYGARRYPGEALERGWHRDRARFDPASLRLPAPEELKSVDAGTWDRSDPWARHPLFPA